VLGSLGFNPAYLDWIVVLPNPHALRSADRREQVVADGVAEDDEWAPFECPDEIATAEVDQVKARASRGTDIPFALRRGTIGQVTTHALDGYARPVRARPPRIW
jgi:hypothetical protein